MQFVDVDVKLVPGAQNLHWGPAVSLDAWYLPLSQRVQAEVRETNSVPAVQKEQFADRAAFSCWYLPAPHSAHSVVVDTNDLPAAHVAQP